MVDEANSVDVGRRASLEELVRRAQSGDKAALGQVLEAVQDDVYGLSLRFLWHPSDAEDATQDILMKVLTRFGTFRGRSSFRTWVYRVAHNALMNFRRSRAEEEKLTFARFGEELGALDGTEPADPSPTADQVLLVEEVRVGCTLGMLLCLDRRHRMAYILGAVLELTHTEAAEIVGSTPAAFRQRLARARKAVNDFMLQRCGLANPSASCRCRKRVPHAIASGRVNPQRLLHARGERPGEAFPAVLAAIRQLQRAQRDVALYKAHRPGPPQADFAAWVRDVVGRHLDGSVLQDPR